MADEKVPSPLHLLIGGYPPEENPPGEEAREEERKEERESLIDQPTPRTIKEAWERIAARLEEQEDQIAAVTQRLSKLELQRPARAIAPDISKLKREVGALKTVVLAHEADLEKGRKLIRKYN